jgi:high-affinity iron transporter
MEGKPGRSFWRRRPLAALAWVIAGCVAIAFLVAKAITAPDGVPDPTSVPLSHGAAVVDSGLLVFREGLEAVLVVAAVTASFVGARQSLRKPVAAGAGLALGASVVTWFLAIAVIGALGGPGLDVQAATGLLAVVVLLVVMNWFFHRLYWTGWIQHHNRRRRDLLAGSGRLGVTAGFVLLGFTAVYREGFELVIFLQNLRLTQGSGVVLEGLAIGLGLTAAVGMLTFLAQHKLPYRKMLVFTGILLGFVLVVMVGEGTQEMQLAGWLPTTSIGLHFPGFLGLWLAVFPTVETLVAQALAAILVVGSYVVAEEMKVRAPRRRGGEPAVRVDSPEPVQPLTLA